MYTFFFWKSSQYGEILDLPVENVVKNVIIQVICVWIEHFTHVFDDIFDSKSKISPFWFDFQKKKCIHEKCATASRIQNILAKVMEIDVFLVKIYKNHRKTVQSIYCVVS
jgi:hypothetical protein